MDERRPKGGKGIELAAVVTGSCSVIATALKVFDAFPSWEPWINGFLVLTVVFTIFFIGWHIISSYGQGILHWIKVFFREEGDKSRDETDWNRLGEALGELNGIPRAVTDTIASGVITFNEAGHVARTLLKTILIRCQRAVEIFCPAVVCSIKILTRRKDGLFFECLYVDNGNSASYDDFVRKFKGVEFHHSYAGRALKANETIFVPNLWEAGRSHPFLPKDADDLRRAGLKGLVVAPVSLANREGHQEAKFVLKIDCFVEDGLVDNPATRIMLHQIVGYCALVVSFAFHTTMATEADFDSRTGMGHDQE